MIKVIDFFTFLVYSNIYQTRAVKKSKPWYQTRTPVVLALVVLMNFR